MMNASSIQTDPKGRTPPIKIVIPEFMCQGASGMTRAICLVLVGTSIVDALRPMKAPTKTMGAEIVTHSKNRTRIVKKLTAVAAPAKLKKMFKTVNIPTKRAGRPVAVAMVFNFQFVDPVNLYTRADVYPAIDPQRT